MSATDHLTRIIDGRLDRSLTPHVDAVDIALADMRAKLTDLLLLPGPRGARARIQIAAQEALQRAIAVELDAGAPEHGVTELLMMTLGELIAGHSLRFSHGAPPDARVELLDLLCVQLTLQARRIVENVDDMKASEVSGVIAPRPKVPGRG